MHLYPFFEPDKVTLIGVLSMREGLSPSTPSGFTLFNRGFFIWGSLDATFYAGGQNVSGGVMELNYSARNFSPEPSGILGCNPFAQILCHLPQRAGMLLQYGGDEVRAQRGAV